jgi:hypothetical protein
MWDEYTYYSSRVTIDDPPNMPIPKVLCRGFITNYFLQPSRRIQHSEEDEGGIRPGGFELLLVFVVPFPSCFHVSVSLTAILVDPSS